MLLEHALWFPYRIKIWNQNFEVSSCPANIIVNFLLRYDDAKEISVSFRKVAFPYIPKQAPFSLAYFQSYIGTTNFVVIIYSYNILFGEIRVSNAFLRCHSSACLYHIQVGTSRYFVKTEYLCKNNICEYSLHLMYAPNIVSFWCSFLLRDYCY